MYTAEMAAFLLGTTNLSLVQSQRCYIFVWNLLFCQGVWDVLFNLLMYAFNCLLFLEFLMKSTKEKAVHKGQ